MGPRTNQIYQSIFLQSTLMTLSFRTDRSGQTVQIQIRLLLEEQSDKHLHCLLVHLHHFQLDCTKCKKAIAVTTVVRAPVLSHLRYSFLEVHILTTTHQKAFILGPQVPCRVSFHSMKPDPRVHAGVGVGLEVKIQNT